MAIQQYTGKPFVGLVREIAEGVDVRSYCFQQPKDGERKSVLWTPHGDGEAVLERIAIKVARFYGNRKPDDLSFDAPETRTVGSDLRGWCRLEYSKIGEEEQSIVNYYLSLHLLAQRNSRKLLAQD